MNRARRACVATRNSSGEAALAWCVEHAGDPTMDAPFVPRSRRRGQRASKDGGSVPGRRGVVGLGDDEEFGGAEMRAAVRAHRTAAAALEAYVRARLSAIERGGGGAGGAKGENENGEGGVPSEEVGELGAVLTSFRRRQSLGAAEERARVLLPAGVDLGRFAGDLRYRQVGPVVDVRVCSGLVIFFFSVGVVVRYKLWLFFFSFAHALRGTSYGCFFLSRDSLLIWCFLAVSGCVSFR